ncbi:MAG: hypothetical protein LBJ76_03465 [Candidatus Accumulibacter sp.]|nr:hypothetical protein [Accumulibacter sp.]
MKTRGANQIREISELKHELSDRNALRKFVEDHGYDLMIYMQMLVDVPTWWGAYEKAMSNPDNVTVDEAGEIDDSRAVALADQALIDAQGSGALSDLSRWERDTGWMRVFTGFMSFMNTTMNLNRRILKSDAGFVEKTAKLMLVNIVPAVLEVVIMNALTGGGDEEDDEFANDAVKSVASFALGQFVVVRELQYFLEKRGYKGPSGTRPISDLYDLSIQIQQDEADFALFKAMISVIGDVFRLPSAQINRTLTGVKALDEGDTDNPAALAFGVRRR